MGRFDRPQLLAQGIAGWQAVSDFLADQPFMLGDRPTALDATAYGFLGSVLGAQVFRSPVHDFIAERQNLVACWDRLRTTCWAPAAAPAASGQAAASAMV
jgi:glutathione S-transferase